MPPMKQYIIIKHVFDALRSHPSLGPKVAGRWMTGDRLNELVKPHLANTYVPAQAPFIQRYYRTTAGK